MKRRAEARSHNPFADETMRLARCTQDFIERPTQAQVGHQLGAVGAELEVLRGIFSDYARRTAELEAAVDQNADTCTEIARLLVAMCERWPAIERLRRGGCQ